METERLNGGIYITPKDIMVLSDCTLRHAQIEHRTVRDILGVKKHRLTVKAYCDYCNIDYDVVVRHLNPYRQNNH